MHELGIANAILEAAEAEASLHPDDRLLAIGVRIGDVAGLDPDALSFCFDALVKDTTLDPLRLEIERMPRRHRCLQCGREFTVVDYQIACPDCGDLRTECFAGFEMDITYLELEAS